MICFGSQEFVIGRRGALGTFVVCHSAPRLLAVAPCTSAILGGVGFFGSEGAEARTFIDLPYGT